MALTIAALPTGAVIGDAECVGKSFPSFYETMGEAGLDYEKIQP